MYQVGTLGGVVCLHSRALIPAKIPLLSRRVFVHTYPSSGPRGILYAACPPFRWLKMASTSEGNLHRQQHQHQHRGRIPTGRISGSGSGLPPPANDTTTTTTTATTASATLPSATDLPSSTFRTVSTIPSAPVPVPPFSVCGHEGGFVQPSSYLRSRPLSYPMPPSQPERAIDREERQGLVSLVLVSLALIVSPGGLLCLAFATMFRIRQPMVESRHLDHRTYCSPHSPELLVVHLP